MEVRYIIFTPDETRIAVIGFVQKQGQIGIPGDVAGVELAGPTGAPIAVVKLQPALGKKPLKVEAQYLVAALLLYCLEQRVPIPKQAEKRVELSVNGLTLVMTSDRSLGSPHLAANQVSYGEMANRATRTIGTMQEELARATARADYAESQIGQAEERAARAEAARAKSSAALVAVTLKPGLRGHVGRWLVGFRHPSGG
jgi:hypothetical protein